MYSRSVSSCCVELVGIESDRHLLREHALKYPSQHICFFEFFEWGEQCEKKIKIAHATLRTVIVNCSRSHTLEHNCIAFFDG